MANSELATFGRLKPMIPNIRTTDEECEVLFELEARETGPIQLGKWVSGGNAGRLVVLRPVDATLNEACVRSVEASRGIAHPRLGKVLGFVSAGGQRYIASEYMEGCTLAELVDAAEANGGSVSPAVAARIVLDALQAVIAGRKLLRDRDAAPEGRCFHADAVWIAEFGETFLLEIGILHHLGRTPPNPELEDLDGEDGDVMSAGAALLQLLGGSPGELERVTSRALAANRADSYDGPEAMVRVLTDLPPNLLATEKEVRETVKRLLGQSFERRKLKLDMLKRDWVATFADLENESTQFYQASELAPAKNEDTLRPPAPAGAQPKAPAQPQSAAAVAVTGTVKVGKPSFAFEDDQTRVFKPTPELLGDTTPEITIEEEPSESAPRQFAAPAAQAAAPSRAPVIWMLVIGLALGIVADRLYLASTAPAACQDAVVPAFGTR